jgi:uncharacterized protein YxeA
MGTLTSGPVKDVYQKLVWYNTSTKKLMYTDGADADAEVDDAKISGDLTITGGKVTFGNGEIIHNETDGIITMSSPKLTLDSTNGEAALNIKSEANNDSKLMFYDGSNLKWTIGQDYSDSAKLKFDWANSAVGGATKLTLNSSGTLTANTSFVVNNISLNTNGVSAVGDITLSADGGNVYMSDATANIFDFNVDDTSMTIHDDQDTGDLFKIEVAQHGVTTMSTVDDDATAANLILDPDGKIICKSANTIELGHSDGLANAVQFQVETGSVDNFQTYASFQGEEGDHSRLTIYEQGGSSANDYLSINVAEHGATTISTIDAASHAADLMIKPDGTTSIGMEDGDSDNFRLVNKNNSNNIGVSFYLENGAQTLLKMYEQGGASNNDYFKIDVQGNGETTLGTVDAATKLAHLNIEPDGHVEFDGCGVGFDLVTPTYNASDTDVDFTTGNKQFVTFGSGNITDLNLIFPKTSGNFTLLLKQDGTGSRTVTNYKAWDVVNSDAASGSATVKFPGGTNPTLTTAANHVDIFSFFYDADNQIAYGVASLDFQD